VTLPQLRTVTGELYRIHRSLSNQLSVVRERRMKQRQSWAVARTWPTMVQLWRPIAGCSRLAWLPLGTRSCRASNDVLRARPTSLSWQNPDVVNHPHRLPATATQRYDGAVLYRQQ